jgi:hypothetical protein
MTINNDQQDNSPAGPQLDKTRKVTELDKAELDALAVSVKAILQTDMDWNGFPNDRQYFVAKRILALLTPPNDKFHYGA